MYRVRCSSIDTLLAGCGKVTNKLEWKNLDKMSDAHIRLAIEIYNKAHGFETEPVTTLDLEAGNEHESEAILMYDEFFKTNFHPAYLKSRKNMEGKDFEASNEYLTGTRDFGDDLETDDCKVSVDKNVFDIKKFKKPETNYVLQLNGYGLLYGTPVLKLYNALMPLTSGQVFKKVSSAAYVKMYGDIEQMELTDRLEKNYNYDLLPLSERIFVREVETIPGFDYIIKKRVERLNEWIDDNKSKLYKIKK